MKQRILSGLLMLPAAALFYFGGKALILGMLVIALIGLYEFYKGWETAGSKPCPWIGYASAVLLYGLGWFTLDQGLREVDFPQYLAWFFLVMMASFITLFKRKDHSLGDGVITAFGAFYVVYFSYHVVLTEYYFNQAVWLIVLTAFGTDIFAYFVGVLFGKHKLCPEISPKKTVEGAIGGVFGSVLFCTVFALLFSKEWVLPAACIGLFGSFFAQLGDLTASIFKRKMGIKDFGKLIPGHGGILDRFDSILFTGPFVYYFMCYYMLITEGVHLTGRL